MTTSVNKGNDNKITALYCRLSVDDADKQADEESNSIKNQKQILQDYCKKNGYHNTRFFIDDGISGTTFDRPGFKEMEALAEEGKIGTIIVPILPSSASASISLNPGRSKVVPDIPSSTKNLVLWYPFFLQ